MGLEALSNGESGPGLWWQPQLFAGSIGLSIMQL